MSLFDDLPDMDWPSVPIGTAVLASNVSNDDGSKTADLSDYQSMQFVTYLRTIGKFICVAEGDDIEDASNLTYCTQCVIEPGIDIPEIWLNIPF